MFSSPCQGHAIHLLSLGDPTRFKRSIPDATSLPCGTLAGSRVAAKISSNSKTSFWSKKTGLFSPTRSTHRVVITTTRTFCSHTMRQKSP